MPKPQNVRMVWAILALIAVLYGTGNAVAQGPVEGTQTIYAPYPGNFDLATNIVGNEVGVDGMGLHFYYNNPTNYTIPGIDILNPPDKKIYSPATFCPSEGDIVSAGDDFIGNGGHGIRLQHAGNKAVGLKILIWHLEKVSELFSQKVAESSCIYSGDLIGYEGESTTVNGVVTAFSAAGGAWAAIEPHSHVSLGRTTPWDEYPQCKQIQLDGYYWVNIACVATKWQQTDVAQTQNASGYNQSLMQQLADIILKRPRGGITQLDTGYKTSTQSKIPSSWIIGIACAMLILWWIVQRLKNSNRRQ